MNAGRTSDKRTENTRTRSPEGRMSASSLSMAMSFDDDAIMCSPSWYDSGMASRRRYGLKQMTIVNYARKMTSPHHSLVAHFAQLHQQIHKLFILYNDWLAKLNRQRRSNTYGCSVHSRSVEVGWPNGT